uniref:odorant receptor 131-2-like n=1 Tax=Gasterosteus aculeatus aculeatus TaxID=481459 RepID=UPI001A9825A8|nr:odorant receptor 131-2-like [Gasterosteus aculeatus aculeatus]
MMSPLTNTTGGLQYQGLLESVAFSMLTTVPCCVFLLVNAAMLLTLRSRPLFRETPRYVLLLNLLCADTAQMALSQLLYLLAASRAPLTYPACGVLVMLADLTNAVSPLTLVAMSLERYVAVCRPLRHAALVTPRSTMAAVAAVWAFSSLNVLTQVVLLLDFPFQDLQSLRMDDFCSKGRVMLGAASEVYDRGYTCFLFVSTSVAVASSYVAVTMAARSASSGGASARRARDTLLLHLVQVGLSLSSTVYSPVLMALSRSVNRLLFVRLQNVLYVAIFIFPRCLSSLIYGLRDKSIQPVLLQHLSCGLKLPIGTSPPSPRDVDV